MISCPEAKEVARMSVFPLRSCRGSETNWFSTQKEYVTVCTYVHASPSAGDTVTIKDGTGAAATTTFTVARNGSKIASSATDLVFDKNFAEITMSYVNATIGWSV